MSNMLKKIGLGFAQAFGFGLFFIIFALAAIYFFTDIDLKLMAQKIGTKTKLYQPTIVKPFDEAQSIQKLFVRRQTAIPTEFLRIHVNTTDALYLAVRQLNQHGGKGAIILADGTYKIDSTIEINQPDIMVVSLSADPYKTILKGRGNRQTGPVNSIFKVKSSNFVLDGVTLTDAPNHLIQVAGELDADNIILRNNIFQDSYEQMIKVSYNLYDNPDVSGDNGIVENNIFQYTLGIANNYYTGGIDGIGAKNWYVDGNIFRDIASPGKNISQYAVHFWVNASNNAVTNNIFIDNDRAIGFGLQLSSNKIDGYKYEVKDGKIQNNYIFHTNNGDPYADVGIALDSTVDVLVENNYVYQSHSYPNAIEYRFAETEGLKIFTNHVNKKIKSRDNAQAEVRGNKVHLTQEEMLLKLSEAMGKHHIQQVY
jgi:hypothetical protein